MKLIKVLSVLVVCFVVLSNSLVIGYAADEEPIFTKEDLLDLGYLEGDGFLYIPAGEDDPLSSMSFLLNQYSNYPDFDIFDLPWGSFPSYVWDVLNLGLEGLSAPVGDSVKIPFVCIRVLSTQVIVYVGINCGVGRYNNASATFGIFASPVASLNSNSVLYSVTYNKSDFSVISDWRTMTPIESGTYGDSKPIYLMSNFNIGSSDTAVDFYFWGANGVGYASVYSSHAYDLNTSTVSGATQLLFTTPKSGFSSGTFYSLQYQDAYNYCAYFNPPTKEGINQQLQQEQNSLIYEGNYILQEQNDTLDMIDDSLNDILNASGDSELTTLPDEALSDFNEAESDLVDDYNPDNLGDDLDIELDSSALECIWGIFDGFVTLDDSVFTLFISVMSIGIIALILGR